VVVHSPSPARYGYYVRVGGAKRLGRDLAEAAGLLAHAYDGGYTSAENRARVSASRERDLTAAELAELIERATAVLA
jgi:hypothetical protein